MSPKVRTDRTMSQVTWDSLSAYLTSVKLLLSQLSYVDSNLSNNNNK